MFFKSKVLPSAMLIMGALALGCGDDSSDDDDGTTQPTPDGGTPSGQLVQYDGTLVSILGTSKADAIPTPHELQLLDNTTGQPLNPPVKTTSASGTGAISFKGPAGVHMLQVVGVGPANAGTSTYDTVIVNADSAKPDPLIRISTAGTLGLAEGSGGFMSKPDRAALGASIYWTLNGVRKDTIGCAKVFLDGATAPDTAQDQRYNGASGLPTTLEKQSQTLSSGRFYIANITEGSHKLKVTLDNGATFLGNEVSFVVPYSRAEAIGPTKAMIVLLSVDIEAPTNPTPAGCVDPAP